MKQGGSSRSTDSMSSATTKAVRAYLKTAKEAISAGDAPAARAACKEALALDNQSYDAWVFDGKAAFAAGDVAVALASYRTATSCRGDHPAAWQGIAEAAGAASDNVTSAEALEKLLSIADAVASSATPVPPEKRLDWAYRSATVLTALGRWTEAGRRWAEVLGEKAVPLTEELRGAALAGAVECALADDAAAAERSGAAAAAAIAAASIVTPTEQEATRAAAKKAHAALPNPTLENAIRALLAHGSNGGRFDPRLHGALLSRSTARLTAASGGAAAAAAALQVLDEAEALVSRCCGGDDVDAGVAKRLVRAAALEATAALDLGWDGEEEGWEEEQSDDDDGADASQQERAGALMRRVAALLFPAGTDPVTVLSEDPTMAVAAAWLTLSERGRSGRVAHLSGSAAGCAVLTSAGRDTLIAAVTVGDATSTVNIAAAAVTTLASAAAAAAAPPPLGPGALVLGWGALAETALMSDTPSVALNAARKGLRALRAVRAAETVATTAPPEPRMRAAERRMRLVAAEALLALGQSTEAAAALQALTPPSPRTLRGLAAAAAAAAMSSGADSRAAAVQAVPFLKEAVTLAPKAPRPLAELGWHMLRAGGIGAETRAQRLLERAAQLAGSGDGESTGDDVDLSAPPPPDIAARLGIARWRASCVVGGGEDKDPPAVVARGPGSAHAALLVAAASDGPWRAAAFSHLGLVYAAGGDTTRANKCHARALSLDPTEPTAGPAMCEAALEAAGGDGDDAQRSAATAAVFAMCRKALSVSPRCLWAAVRLSSLAAAAGDHKEAVGALQAVLRAASSSAAVWEALGAAYDALGRHSAALKAYARAQEVEKGQTGGGTETSVPVAVAGGRVYAAVQSGKIMQQMGKPREAIEAYEGALAACPEHTAALLGLAEAELVRALAATRGGALGRAAAAADRAAAAAAAAASGRDAPRRTALKLLGDAYLAAARTQDPRVKGHEQDTVAEVSSAIQRGVDVLRRSAAASAAACRAYARVVAMSPNVAAAWGDLAAACAAGSTASGHGKSNNPGERALRAALRIDSTDPTLWTALGTFPLPSSSVAPGEDAVRRDWARRETALARAVQLHPQHSPAWTALGRLYLTAAAAAVNDGEGHETFLRRAERALDQARAADPSSGAAWVATALLHTARRDSTEAAGAFRMAAELGAGYEADLGRALTGLRAAAAAAEMGCSSVYDTAGAKVTSLGGAYASARRARESAPLDPAAALALGLTAEVKGLAQDAREAYEDSIELGVATKDDGSCDEALRTVVVNEARAGLARVSALAGSGGEVIDGVESPAVTAVALLTSMFADDARGLEEQQDRCGTVLETGLAVAAADEGMSGTAALKAELVRLTMVAATVGVPSPPDLLVRIGELSPHSLARLLATSAAAATVSSASSQNSGVATAAAVVHARVAMRECCPPHAMAARVSSMAGVAAVTAGDALLAARHFTKAVHLSPSDVLLRGALARVLPVAGASLTESAARLVPTPRAANFTRIGLNPSSAQVACETAAATAAGAAAGLAASPGGTTPEAVVAVARIGRRLSHAYHMYPSGAKVGEVRAMLALVAARRAAAGDYIGPRSAERAAAACVSLGEAAMKSSSPAICGPERILASALFTAAAEVELSRAKPSVDVALSHARRGVEAATAAACGKGGTMASSCQIGAVIQVARCHWAAGNAAAAAEELSSVMAAADTGSSLLAAATAAAASATVAMLPAVDVKDLEPDAAPAVMLAAAAATAARGDSLGAEKMLRDASRTATETGSAASGAQPEVGTAARLLLGALLLARARSADLGGGGETKSAKESGKILARVLRSGVGVSSGSTAAAAATLCMEAETITAAAKGVVGGASPAPAGGRATVGWRAAGLAQPGWAHGVGAAAAVVGGDGAGARCEVQKAVHAAPCKAEHWHEMWMRAGSRV